MKSSRCFSWVFAALLFGVCVLEVAHAPLEMWNGYRLSGPYAFRMGLKVFGLATEGPALSGLNGPVQVLAFLPATFSSIPSLALQLGSFLSVAYILSALALLVRLGPEAKEDRLPLWLLLAFGFLALAPVRMSTFLVHADAPGLALSIVGLAFLSRWRGENDWRPLVMASFALVSAMAAKMTFLPLLVAPVLFGLGYFGVRSALRAAAVTGAALLTVAVLSSSIFGARELWFGMFATAAKSQWLSSTVSNTIAETWPQRIRGILAFSVMLAKSYLPLWVAAVVALRWIFAGGKWRTVPGLALAALFTLLLLPPSILGRLKVGGAPNTLSPTLAFLVVTLVLAAGALRRRPELARGVGSVAAVMLVALAVCEAPTVPQRLATWPTIVDNPQDKALAAARAHPGEIYLPEFPLAHLIAEGRLYHSGMALFEYRNYRDDGSVDIAKFLPERMDRVVTRYPWNDLRARYFPSYAAPTALPELPGWTVLTRSPKEAASFSDH